MGISTQFCLTDRLFVSAGPHCYATLFSFHCWPIIASCIANGARQWDRALFYAILVSGATFGGIYLGLLPVQIVTSYSSSAAQISYKGDEISRLCRLFFET